MAEQDFIYPAEPLLIVDRQYRRKKHQTVDSSAFPFGQPSAMSQSQSSESTSRTLIKMSRPESPQRQHSKIPPTKKRQGPKPKVDHYDSEANSATTGRSATDSVSTREACSQETPPLRLGSLVPNSSTTFYAYAESYIKPNAQELLQYYADGIGRVFYPLEQIVSFDINPVRAAWLPLAAEDESLLNSILLCSETHRNYMLTKGGIDKRNPYYQQAIENVNARLSAGEICDAVIGAVSCLTLIEHFYGNLDASSLHRAGLVEMIRVRGGIQTIRRSLDMKIYRADLLPAVDRLIPPKLPRLRSTVPSLYTMILPKGALNHQLTKSLVSTGMSLHVIEIMTAMNSLSKSLQYAVDHDLTIPSRSFDEDTMGIQHDLLLMPVDDATDIDIASRSAALIYMKSLTREDPCNFEPIIDPLVTAIERTEIDTATVRLLFWISMMGAMFAQRLSTRIWFREQLVILCEFLGIVEWSQAQTILQSISWVTKIHSKAGQENWVIVDSMRPGFTKLTTP